MKKILFVSLALAGWILNAHAADGYANSVVSYNPGVGYDPGYTNAVAALGEPARVTPGAYGGPVDPFDPPYLPSQLVSIGEGGSLTVKFKTPILNHPHNPFGVDFIIFGNSFFVVTNDFDFTTFQWVGTPATDGSMFANNPGANRVSVSRDGKIFYVLNPALAPVVDGLFPTDGRGNFHKPVNPIFTQDDFSGLTLDDIRFLYNGSARRDRLRHFVGAGRQRKTGEADRNQLHPRRSLEREDGGGGIFRRFRPAGQPENQTRSPLTARIPVFAGYEVFRSWVRGRRESAFRAPFQGPPLRRVLHRRGVATRRHHRGKFQHQPIFGRLADFW